MCAAAPRVISAGWCIGSGIASSDEIAGRNERLLKPLLPCTMGIRKYSPLCIVDSDKLSASEGCREPSAGDNADGERIAVTGEAGQAAKRSAGGEFAGLSERRFKV